MHSNAGAPDGSAAPAPRLACFSAGPAPETTAVSTDELTLDAITADFRIYQRRRGHRFSLDDLATAWEAAQCIDAPQHCVDLGCGIGSVLLMLCWRFPRASMVGIEALPMSFALARRNVSHNGLHQRVTLLAGDLRDITQRWSLPRAQLVTGTPPYLPEGTALASPDPQRAAARIEYRGGVEAYLQAAARVLAPCGRVVVCAGGGDAQRVVRGADSAGLALLRRRDVYARTGQKKPLFGVWTLAWPSDVTAALEQVTLVARDATGARSVQARALRQAFGLDDG
ncbi:MAG TPA: methyltransferase domain-containing protein [Sorangium sp.]|nr:methyltransferase domain-containing protein [Sorangium sp.]